MSNKKDRDIIFKKFGGRCAYCGCHLAKGWHVSKILSESPVIDGSGNLVAQNDTLENKIPSCAPCNMSRTRDNGGVRFATIEVFRQELESDFFFIKAHPYYQRMLRFGLIQETGKAFKFYFETYNDHVGK